MHFTGNIRKDLSGCEHGYIRCTCEFCAASDRNKKLMAEMLAGLDEEEAERLTEEYWGEQRWVH